MSKKKLIPGQIPPSFGVKDIGDISICPLYLKEYVINSLIFNQQSIILLLYY